MFVFLCLLSSGIYVWSKMYSAINECENQRVIKTEYTLSFILFFLLNLLIVCKMVMSCVSMQLTVMLKSTKIVEIEPTKYRTLNYTPTHLQL